MTSRLEIDGEYIRDSMLTNSEAWSNVTEAELNHKCFETVDLMLLPSSLVHRFLKNNLKLETKEYWVSTALHDLKKLEINLESLKLNQLRKQMLTIY